MTAQTPHRSTSALVVVDVQNDFCEGGSLAVMGGRQVAAAVSNYIARQRHHYQVVVATRDWHINPGTHFSTHPDFSTTWPQHCVAGTSGANFHPAFVEPVDRVFSKGEFSAAYSGFEGRDSDGTLLAHWLQLRAIDHLDIVGIATDYCVKATALDGASNGFSVRVMLDLTAGVSPATTAKAIYQLDNAGVQAITGTIEQP